MSSLQKNFFYAFAFSSIVCFLTEAYEIIYNITIYWSDHLHNAIDHFMFVMVYYIGFTIKKMK